MDFREWTALILMALGTNTMAMISTKRAKQRAKKASGEGASHQQALDDIARAEGHAHWGAKLQAAKEPAQDVSEHPLRPDFLDPAWVRAQEGHEDAIRTFVAQALAGHDTRRGGVLEALSSLLVDSWLGGRDHSSRDFPSFVHAMMNAAVRRNLERSHEALMAMSFHNGTWQDEMVAQLAHAQPDDPRLATLQRAAATEISTVSGEIVDNANAIIGDPVLAMRRASIDNLPVKLVAQVLMASFTGSPPSRVVLAVMHNILWDDLPSRSIAEARLALGTVVDRVAVVNLLQGADRDRKLAILRIMIEMVPFSVHWTKTKYLDVVQKLREEHPSSLMLSWLDDAFRKIGNGQMPFSFNPLADGDTDAARLATRALIEMQIESRAHGIGPQQPNTVADAIQLVEDVLTVIRDARRIEEFEPGLTQSYPSVRTVLQQCRQKPGQLELFASFNRMDGLLIDRLGAALNDEAVMSLAIEALSPFENEAMRRAAA